MKPEQNNIILDYLEMSKKWQWSQRWNSIPNGRRIKRKKS